MARIVELIESSCLIGEGREDDPSRVQYELWTKDGQQVAAWDPHTGLSWYRPPPMLQVPPLEMVSVGSGDAAGELRRLLDDATLKLGEAPQTLSVPRRLYLAWRRDERSGRWCGPGGGPVFCGVELVATNS